jgi:hypothetical protein
MNTKNTTKLIISFLARACIIKPIMAVIYGFQSYARVYVPDKPFKPSLVFVGKARSLP